jgi:flagellar biogenesis protein FliO
MIWYFLLTAGASAVLFLLGAYSVQVSILIGIFKLLFIVAIIAALIWVYKSLSSRRKLRLPARNGDG